MPPEPPRLAERFAAFRARLLPGRVRPAALDAGCGDGLYAEAMARAGFAVLAVDRDPAHCARASARGIPRVAAADIFTHDFGGERFDLVLAKGFPPLLSPDPYEVARALLRLRELLAPGGALLFWTVTDLSGRVGPSGLVMRDADFLRARFDEATLYPLHRFQYRLPHGWNALLSRLILRAPRLPRPMNVVATLRG